MKVTRGHRASTLSELGTVGFVVSAAVGGAAAGFFAGLLAFDSPIAGFLGGMGGVIAALLGAAKRIEGDAGW